MQKKTAEPHFRAPTCGCSAMISRNYVLLWFQLPIFHAVEVLSVDVSAPFCTRVQSIAWQLTEALRFKHLLQNISACRKAAFCWNWTLPPPMQAIHCVRHSVERCPVPFGRVVMRICVQGYGKEKKQYLICKVTMPPMNSSQTIGRKRRDIPFSFWITL